MAAAIDDLAPLADGVPLVVAACSFGADVSLERRRHPRLDAWLAIAPPLRGHRPVDGPGRGRPAPEAAGRAASTTSSTRRERPAATVDIVAEHPVEVDQPGADHFLVGRIDRVVELCADLCRSLASEG